MALLLLLCLAGAQPSVVRGGLMAAIALLIREAGHHSRPVGVLMLTLSGMLLLCQACSYRLVYSSVRRPPLS